jgi:pyruvate/2-oxoglutarate dehydrogenase complex dihydrolipoamide acyltransferase (E2) component
MSEAVPVVINRDNVNDDSVILMRWFVPLGAYVESDQLIAEIETSKATVEIHSPSAGYIRYTAKEKEEILVGQALCFIIPELFSFEGAEAGKQNSPARANNHLDGCVSGNDRSEMNRSTILTTESQQQELSPKSVVTRFSDAAAELMKKYDLKPEMFAHRTLIRERDVLEFLKKSVASGTESDSAGLGMTFAATAVTPAPSLPHSVRRLPAAKRFEIRQISSGVNNSIASSVTVACSTCGFRRALQTNPIVAGNAGAVVVFEVARLLRKYPVFNAVYRLDAICLFDKVNIGFAVNDGRGLKVPVIPECDRLELSEVSTKMRELTVAYLEDKLSPEDLAGGTFTISDLGAFGVSHFTPLLSGDQSAILGIGSEVFLPGASSGLYHLTLVFDHQLSDGRTAALFLNELKLRLESYENALDPSLSDVPTDLSCKRCLRSAMQLADLGGCLLRLAMPDEYICSLCVLGY